MGLDRTIRFPEGATPRWEAIRDRLAHVGEAMPIRMIDGLPAFPDEVPAADWEELRLGAAGGMVTIRRRLGMLTCVVWGNADPVLTIAFAKVIWACAAAGGGCVDTDSGPVAADEFARGAGIKID